MTTEEARHAREHSENKTHNLNLQKHLWWKIRYNGWSGLSAAINQNNTNPQTIHIFYTWTKASVC